MDSAERYAAEPHAADVAPTLEQRLSPWLTIRTTVKEQGLVIQIARPFRERVTAVGFERLLLEPAQVSFVRTDRLWLAAVLAGSGLGLSWLAFFGLTASEPAGPVLWARALGALAPLLGPGLLAAAILELLLAVADPRRVSVFLDREQALHPKVVRGGEDEPQAAAFVEDVKRAIVIHRCQGPSAEAPGEAGAESDDEEAVQPSLADTLDALLSMRTNGLLDDQELERFQELAERR